MSNDQAILEEIIKVAPGFIGKTAQNYVTSFPSLTEREAIDIEIFNRAFTTVLITRSLHNKYNTYEAGNLLSPIYRNGIEKIYKCFMEIGIGDELKYKLDLPTMVLYAMMLESLELRKIFEKAYDNNFFYTTALRAIHGETSKGHYRLEKIKEDDFIETNLGRLRKFISLYRDTSVDRQKEFMSRLFSGNKKLNLEDMTSTSEESKTKSNIESNRQKRIHHIDKLRKEIEINYKFLGKLNNLQDIKAAYNQISGEIVNLGIEAQSIQDLTDEEYKKKYLIDEL